MKLQVYLIDYFREVKDNGLNTYITQLGNGLEINGGIDLTYVWTNSKYLDLKIEYLASARELHIPTFSTQDRGYNADGFLSNVLINDMKTKTNIIVHLNWINHCSVAWHLKQRIDCKIILTKHCIPWRDFVNNNLKDFYKLNAVYEKRKKITHLLPKLQSEKINYESIDHIITVTDCAKDNLTNLFSVSSERITTINNGIQIQYYDKNKQKKKLRRTYGFSVNDKIILFAGTVKESKGVFDLVKVFEKLVARNPENIRLVIAGSGNLSLLLQKTKKYWSKITITGSLDKPTLYDFFCMSDIGVVPSYVEQCSYTAIEMMQMGLPIIVSDVDGLKEIVLDECGLRVKVNFTKGKPVVVDSKELFTKLEYFLQNESIARRFAKNAQKHALKTFKLDNMVDRTIEVYRNVIREGPEIEQLKYPLPIFDKDACPLVTVILSCEDGPTYLNLCVASILSQSYSNFELFVVDNEAVDISRSFVETYCDDRIKYLSFNKNISKWDLAIDIAKGKYIIHLNAEDWVHPHGIALQIDFLERNPDYAMVGSWCEIIDAFGKVTSRVQTSMKHEDISLALLFGNPFSQALTTVRMHFAKKYRFNVKFKHCEDYILWLEIVGDAKMEILPYNLLKYREYAGCKRFNDKNPLKKNMTSILGRNLDELNINYSSDEFTIHLALSFNYEKYFNSDEKSKKLKNWLDKLFSAKALTDLHSAAKLNSYKRNLLYSYL
ncbi:glycosyltransferase involved in cell wall biosynthesis [Arcticibacter tournemirensis]|uniref:Glycosyltransferase n=1 Tax=Arcticibacter tournemirensis TaxID=699437 RepID=A0A5M9GK68_9SPHI|nr:glycosyltransferase [Arcticibacter tournemirensis]KAA8474327.1 glycosyltransferase [Arcticibacter tournemirensis]TQM51733.1 glycosyltransferase involved in cell wall biosynthesis [Arcticibacter tournemirensis]